MKFVSWNVNGLRAVMKKGFEDIVRDLDADIVALQETKLQEGQATLDLPEYREYWSLRSEEGLFGHGGVFQTGSFARAARHWR